MKRATARISGTMRFIRECLEGLAKAAREASAL